MRIPTGEGRTGFPPVAEHGLEARATRSPAARLSPTPITCSVRQISLASPATTWTTSWRPSPSSSAKTSRNTASTVPSELYWKSMMPWPKPCALANPTVHSLPHLLILVSRIRQGSEGASERGREEAEKRGIGDHDALYRTLLCPACVVLTGPPGMRPSRSKMSWQIYSTRG